MAVVRDSAITDAHNHALDALIEMVVQRNNYRDRLREADDRLNRIFEYVNSELLPTGITTDLLSLLK
jgi:hypothetical protein